MGQERRVPDERPPLSKGALTGEDEPQPPAIADARRLAELAHLAAGERKLKALLAA
jgi:hypothetical protein